MMLNEGRHFLAGWASAGDKKGDLRLEAGGFEEDK